MTFFVACLKEFAEFANAKDKEANIPPEKCFKLPYKLAIRTHYLPSFDSNSSIFKEIIIKAKVLNFVWPVEMKLIVFINHWTFWTHTVTLFWGLSFFQPYYKKAAFVTFITLVVHTGSFAA